MHGAIALQPLRRQLPGFDTYFRQLTEEYFKEVAAGAEPRNPWYEEYYQAYCNCSHHSQAGQHSNTITALPLSLARIHISRTRRSCLCAAQPRPLDLGVCTRSTIIIIIVSS